MAQGVYCRIARLIFIPLKPATKLYIIVVNRLSFCLFVFRNKIELLNLKNYLAVSKTCISFAMPNLNNDVSHRRSATVKAR